MSPSLVLVGVIYRCPFLPCDQAKEAGSLVEDIPLAVCKFLRKLQTLSEEEEAILVVLLGYLPPTLKIF